MTHNFNQSGFSEFRLYYFSDCVFTCFAKNADSAIEQLAEVIGEGFEFSKDVTEIKIGTANGWENVSLPKYHAIK